MAEDGAGAGVFARRAALNFGRTNGGPGCEVGARSVSAVCGINARQDGSSDFASILDGEDGGPNSCPGARANCRAGRSRGVAAPWWALRRDVRTAGSKLSMNRARIE